MVEEFTEKKENNDKKNLLKILGPTFSIIMMFVLIIIKSQNEDFPLVGLIMSFVALFIFFVGTWKGSEIYEKLNELNKKDKKDNTKIPEAITIEQAKTFIEKKLLGLQYSDHVRGWQEHQVHVVGKTSKQNILVVRLERTLYSKFDFQYFFINLHFPEKLWSFKEREEEISERKLVEIYRKMATDPNDEPDTKVIEENNPLLGIQRKTTIKTKREEEDKKRLKKMAEDLT